jgi:hypothetical protein
MSDMSNIQPVKFTSLRGIVLVFAYFIAGLSLYIDARNWSEALLNSSMAIFQLADGGVSSLAYSAMKSQIGFQLPGPTHFLLFASIFSFVLRKIIFKHLKIDWQHACFLSLLAFTVYLIFIVQTFGDMVTYQNTFLSVLLGSLGFAIPWIIFKPQAERQAINDESLLQTLNWKSYFKIAFVPLLEFSFVVYLVNLLITNFGILTGNFLLVNNLFFSKFINFSNIILPLIAGVFFGYYIWTTDFLSRFHLNKLKLILLSLALPWFIFLFLTLPFLVIFPGFIKYSSAELIPIALVGGIGWFAIKRILKQRQKNNLLLQGDEAWVGPQKFKQRKNLLILGVILALFILAPIYSFLNDGRTPGNNNNKGSQPPLPETIMGSQLQNPSGYQWVELGDFNPSVSGNLAKYSVLLPQGYIKYKMAIPNTEDYVWGSPDDIDNYVKNKSHVDFTQAQHPIFYISNTTSSIITPSGEIGDEDGAYDQAFFQKTLPEQGGSLNSFKKGYFNNISMVPVVSIVATIYNSPAYMTYIYSPADKALALVSLKGVRDDAENLQQWNKFVESLNISENSASSTHASIDATNTLPSTAIVLHSTTNFLPVVKGLNEAKQALSVGTRQAELLRFSIQAPASGDIFVDQTDISWTASVTHTLANLSIVSLPDQALVSSFSGELGNASNGNLGMGFSSGYKNIIHAGQTTTFSVRADINGPVGGTTQAELIGFYFNKSGGDWQRQPTKIFGPVFTLQ